jgi:scyllo-inositol 2-dehydrogenase (NADP+)
MTAVALIGFGLAGENFHAPFVATTRGLELAVVVTSDSERRARAEAAYPGVEVLGSAGELWSRAGDLGLVVIATPNSSHVPLASSALAAGLNVVVDKPLAPTSAAARGLVEESASAGKLLTVFPNRRWDGDFLTVRRLINEGALGRVGRFESRMERWRPAVEDRWRESPDPEAGGGVLLDLGSHLVDQALQLFGPVRDLYSEVATRRPGAQVEDDVFLALEHESGVRSHLWMSLVAAQPGPHFRVLGDRAAYVKHGEDVQEAALRSGRRPDDPDWGEEPEGAWGLLGAGGDVRRVPSEPGNYGGFYEGVAAALRDAAPPPVDPLDAIAALEVLEAAR